MSKYIKINELTSYGDDYCEYYNNDECSFHETYSDILIDSISIVDKSSYYDFVVGDDFKRRDIVYLIYVSYETGSSFNHHHGNHVCVNIFKNDIDVWWVVRMIEEAAQEGKYYFEYVAESGKTMTCCCSRWTGYFEQVENVLYVFIRK